MKITRRSETLDLGKKMRSTLWLVMILSGLIGAAFYLVIYGADKLDFTYTDWLLEPDRFHYDLKQHYLGWLEYRRSAWHFPLGLMENVVYPDLVSVIYTDSIPIFAFVCKLLSRFLPQSFQYFGLFGLLSAMLMGVFSACFIWHFVKRPIWCVLSSVFFSGSLLVLMRTYYHTALSAQWVVLAALYLWLCRDREAWKTQEGMTEQGCSATARVREGNESLTSSAAGPLPEAVFNSAKGFSSNAALLQRTMEDSGLQRGGALIAARSHSRRNPQRFSLRRSASCGGAWSLLSVLALLIHAYFLPMVWGCMLCSCLGLFLHRQVKRSMAILCSAIPVPLLAGWAFGLFYGDVPAGGGGLEKFSFNLNGFLNAQGYSSLFAALPTYTYEGSTGQYEGLAYLGAGILALLAVCLLVFIVKRRKIYPAIRRRLCFADAFSYLFFTAGFVLFSMGPVLTLGAAHLTLKVPEVVLNLWGIFRSSGRMIWPVYYAIMLFACVATARLIRGRIAGLTVLALAVAVQLVDLSGAYGDKITQFHTAERISYSSTLTDSAWEELASRYRHIMYYPNTGTLYYSRRGMEVQYYSIQNNMTVNCAYLSRDVTEGVNGAVLRYFETLGTDSEYSHTFYIFPDRLPDDDCGLFWYLLDGIPVATPDPLDSGDALTLKTLRNEVMTDRIISMLDLAEEDREDVSLFVTAGDPKKLADNILEMNYWGLRGDEAVSYYCYIILGDLPDESERVFLLRAYSDEESLVRGLLLSDDFSYRISHPIVF